MQAVDRRCTFELVGDDYVHGLMDGEGLADLEGEKNGVGESSETGFHGFSSSDISLNCLSLSQAPIHRLRPSTLGDTAHPLTKTPTSVINRGKPQETSRMRPAMV